jgi:hypothetical protein
MRDCKARCWCTTSIFLERWQLLWNFDGVKLLPPVRATHPSRILLLYGFLRGHWYSRLTVVKR